MQEESDGSDNETAEKQNLVGHQFSNTKPNAESRSERWEMCCRRLKAYQVFTGLQNKYTKARRRKLHSNNSNNFNTALSLEPLLPSTKPVPMLAQFHHYQRLRDFERCDMGILSSIFI